MADVLDEERDKLKENLLVNGSTPTRDSYIPFRLDLYTLCAPFGRNARLLQTDRQTDTVFIAVGDTLSAFRLQIYCHIL